MVPGDVVTLVDYEPGESVFLRENPGATFFDIQFPDPPRFCEGELGILLETMDKVDGPVTGTRGALYWARILAPAGVGWVPRLELKVVA